MVAFSLREFLSAFVVLFAVIDIIGTAPIIIDLRKKGKIVSATRAGLISLIVFIGFFYLGEAFLRLFHLDISSFAVAGSIIIFALSMEMILPKDATITPVVFPLIVGAGSLTTLLSIRAQYQDINILLAVVANMIIVFLVLVLAKRFEKILAPGVIYIFQKLFGIILLAISVKLFITNLSLLIKEIGY